MATLGTSHGFKHEQTFADTTWVISHHLDTTAPVVDCWVEDAGSVVKILPTTVTVVDNNTVSLLFSIARSGIAYIV